MDAVIYKTDNETIKLSADMADVMEAADVSLTGVSVTGVDSGLASAASLITSATSAGLVITANFAGGVDGEDYVVRMRATGNSSLAVREKVYEIRNRSTLVGAL